MKIKDKVLEIGKAVWKDIKNIKWALLAILLYYILTRIIFREFCPMRIFTGLPCPGCGATRAGIYVLTLRFKEAWQMNPTIFLWILYIIFLLWQRYIGKKRRKLSKILLVFVCFCAIMCYIIGMLYYFPNKEPYTYYEGNLILKGLGL